MPSQTCNKSTQKDNTQKHNSCAFWINHSTNTTTLPHPLLLYVLSHSPHYTTQHHHACSYTICHHIKPHNTTSHNIIAYPYHTTPLCCKSFHLFITYHTITSYHMVSYLTTPLIVTQITSPHHHNHTSPQDTSIHYSPCYFTSSHNTTLVFFFSHSTTNYHINTPFSLRYKTYPLIPHHHSTLYHLPTSLKHTTSPHNSAPSFNELVYSEDHHTIPHYSTPSSRGCGI